MRYLAALFTISFFTASTVYSQCDGRYLSPVFSNVHVQKDVLYGNAVKDNSVAQNLFMDIYTGEGDTATNRPVIIVCHGGSFTGGGKAQDDMPGICTGLAKRGYVVASIQYRLTAFFNVLNSELMVKAVMRAVQDGKAAVRFFRKDADTDNLYNIDPDQIFVGGTSAGGILGLHLTYMDDVSQLSTTWQGYVADLGGLEGESGNQGYSSVVQGVFAYAGGLADSSWIETSEVPLMTTHSENDNTVRYGVGVPLGINTLPNLYGSQPLKMRADNVGVRNDFYSYAGGAHPPHAAGAAIMDSAIHYTSKFIHSLLPCSSESVGIVQMDAHDMELFPNPVTDNLNIRLASGLSNVDLDVFDLIGKKVLELKNIKNEDQISLSALEKGSYLIQVKSESQTISRVIVKL